MLTFIYSLITILRVLGLKRCIINLITSFLFFSRFIKKIKIYFRHYLEWFEHQLLRNLKHWSVVVLDNAPYHNARTPESCNPTIAWAKADIHTWLSKRNIKFIEDLVKPELLSIAGCNRVDPVYKTDEIPEKLGHRVIRLPPRHCELNPIELIHADLKGISFKLQDIKNLFYQAEETITGEKWGKAVKHVIHVNDVKAHLSWVGCFDRPEFQPVVISFDELDIDNV